MPDKKKGNYKIFRCEVDLYRNGTVFRDKNSRLYDRQTEGVYYVSAKNKKHAMLLLQKAIGFGQICVPRHQWIPDDLPEIKPGRILKATYGGPEPYTDQIAHATDPAAKSEDAPPRIFRFRRTGTGGYIGSCGGISLSVSKSFGTMNWRWELRAAMGSSRSVAYRSGRVRAVDAEDAQTRSISSACGDIGSVLKDDPDTMDQDERGALESALELLSACRCVTA